MKTHDISSLIYLGTFITSAELPRSDLAITVILCFLKHVGDDISCCDKFFLTLFRCFIFGEHSPLICSAIDYPLSLFISSVSNLSLATLKFSPFSNVFVSPEFNALVERFITHFALTIVNNDTLVTCNVLTGCFPSSKLLNILI
uniref:Uncharacterized protein n=1 Tax=Trichobilharzia regenti TaxID=157069 RepID=A0AA85ISR3_TRIRE|nr:unnamed protein product [Trichobilharzia regenti]